MRASRLTYLKVNPEGGGEAGQAGHRQAREGDEAPAVHRGEEEKAGRDQSAEARGKTEEDARR